MKNIKFEFYTSIQQQVQAEGIVHEWCHRYFLRQNLIFLPCVSKIVQKIDTNFFWHVSFVNSILNMLKFKKNEEGSWKTCLGWHAWSLQNHTHTCTYQGNNPLHTVYHETLLKSNLEGKYNDGSACWGRHNILDQIRPKIGLICSTI